MQYFFLLFKKYMNCQLLSFKDQAIAFSQKCPNLLNSR